MSHNQPEWNPHTHKHTHTQFSSLPNLTSNQLFTWKFVLNSQHVLTVLNRMCEPRQVLVSTFSLFCRFWPLLSPSASKQSIAHLFTRTRTHLHRLTSVGAPDHNLCLIYAQLCCEATRLFMLFMRKQPAGTSTLWVPAWCELSSLEAIKVVLNLYQEDRKGRWSINAEIQDGRMLHRWVKFADMNE